MELVNQSRELLEDRALSFFVPNAAQQRYIDAVGNPEGFIIVFSAGNGVGKTAATAALIAAIIWPEFAPQDVFKSWIYQNWPYPRDIRIVSTPQEIGEGGSIQREFKRWFPKGEYAAVKNGKSYLSQYLAKDFTVNLMSYDMAIEAFEGATLGCTVFNEPPPRAIFNASAARMRRGGRVLFPGTPLMDSAWILDDLVSKADGKYIQLVGGDIEDNCKQHSKNGLLEHSDIERMIKSYDPDEVEARTKGQFMHLSGRIFKTFDRNIHVREFDIPQAGVSHGMIVDPAIAKPMAIVWRFIDKTGTLHYYDEHPDFEFQNSRDSNLTVSDYVTLIKSRENGRRIDSRILDRHFGNARRTLGGLTLKQEFGEAGLDFSDSYSMDPAAEVEAGILKVKEYLKHDKSKPIDALNSPRVVIHPRCKNLIAALERWSRDAKTGKPSEDYKDFADLIRYDCMSSPMCEDQVNWPTDVKKPYYGV